MAREILFKAKRIDNGEWVEGSLITGVFCRLGQDIPYIFCPEKADYDCFEDFSETNGIFEVQPDTICQYTGLTDKNGNKIWENDILDADEVNSLVRFDEENARFVLDDYGIKGCLMEYGFDENAGGYGFIETNGFDDFMDITEAVEVIGNIFDNPELLGGGE